MRIALFIARAAVEAVVIVLFLAEIVAVCALISRCSGGAS